MRCLIVLALFGCVLAGTTFEFPEGQVFDYEPVTFALEGKVNETVECIRGVLNKGLPNIGLPSFNPLDVKEISLNLDSLGLPKFVSGKLTGTNVKINGITSWFTKALKGKITVFPPGYELEGEATIEKIDGKGDYDGKINLINKHDLFGKGKIDADVQKINIKFFVKIKIGKGKILKNLSIEKLSVKVGLGKVKATITGYKNSVEESIKVSKWLSESLVPELTNNPDMIDKLIIPHVKDGLNAYLAAGPKPGGIVEGILKVCSLPF